MHFLRFHSLRWFQKKVIPAEDLRYRSFHWFFRVRLVLRRVAESECRLQPSTKVAKYRLQCRKFIATQFLAQDLKQYPVSQCQVGVTASQVKQRRRKRRGWRCGRRWSKNWLDSTETSFEQAALYSWIDRGQGAPFYLQIHLHSESWWEINSDDDTERNRPMTRRKVVHQAHYEKKNGHGTSRSLQKEKWPR